MRVSIISRDILDGSSKGPFVVIKTCPDFFRCANLYEFPINFASTPVQYGSSDVLRCSVTFNYERYVAGESTNLSIAKGVSENNF